MESHSYRLSVLYYKRTNEPVNFCSCDILYILNIKTYNTYKFINCLSILNDASKSEQGFAETELGFMKESITNNKSAFLVLSTEIKFNTFFISLYER